MLLAVGELYNRPLSSVSLDLHFRALADLALAEVERAITTHLRQKAFFPTPAELREAVEGSVEDRAELAWTALLRLVRQRGWINPPEAEEWPDEALRRAAVELYGGWTALCERLPAEGPGFAAAAKQFKATYASYARRAAREALPWAPSLAEVPDGR
jgi:hypothetical protein